MISKMQGAVREPVIASGRLPATTRRFPWATGSLSSPPRQPDSQTQPDSTARRSNRHPAIRSPARWGLRGVRYVTAANDCRVLLFCVSTEASSVSFRAEKAERAAVAAAVATERQT